MNEKIKDKALEIAEKHVLIAIDDVYEIAQIYVDDTESTLDDTLLAGLTLLKGMIKEQAEKIHEPKEEA